MKPKIKTAYPASPLGPACQGKNCGCTDSVSHSLECRAEHEANTKFNQTCGTCQFWRPSWASSQEEKKGERGGCSKTRCSSRFTILNNVAREARFGWLETPKDHACILWAERKTKS